MAGERLFSRISKLQAYYEGNSRLIRKYEGVHARLFTRTGPKGR